MIILSPNRFTSTTSSFSLSFTRGCQLYLNSFLTPYTITYISDSLTSSPVHFASLQINANPSPNHNIYQLKKSSKCRCSNFQNINNIFLKKIKKVKFFNPTWIVIKKGNSYGNNLTFLNRSGMNNFLSLIFIILLWVKV